jgi:hypothetical protein
MNTVMQETIQIEQDVLVPNAGGGSIYVYVHDGPWCQIKAAEYVGYTYTTRHPAYSICNFSGLK